MPTEVKVFLNGNPLTVDEGCTVAAALLSHGFTAFRRSVSGSSRAPLCGMGICYECRVRVDGELHQRACMLLCRDGMRIETDGHAEM